MTEPSNTFPGDDRRTRLLAPERVSKDAVEVRALSRLQAASVAIGQARAVLAQLASELRAPLAPLDAGLRELQRHIYIMNADLVAISPAAVQSNMHIPRLTAALVEATADIALAATAWLTELAGPPSAFVTPTGHPLATALYWANEVVRQAELFFIAALRDMPLDSTAKWQLIPTWLNHTSVALYYWARIVNWQTGSVEEYIVTDRGSGEVGIIPYRRGRPATTDGGR